MYPAIPYIADTLGHSVIYEEHKGDFAHAREVAELELINAQRSGDLGRLADALLARGVVHLLQGEPPQAIQYFEELQRTVPSDGNRVLRAISYSNLATYWRYNLFPDGSAANAAELQVRWNGLEYAQSQDSQREVALRQATDSDVKFELLFVFKFLSNLLPSRSFVQVSRHQTTSAMTSQLLQFTLQSIEGFRKEANHIAPTLLAYADLAAADLCHRAGNGQWGEQFLQRASEIYHQNRDLSGAGTCRMIAGDWLAAPFSSPAVWNFAIQDSNSSGSDLSWTLEAEEFNLSGANLPAARQLYDQAKAIFETAGAVRGIANLDLRYGYLAMLEDNYETAMKHAQQASDAFGDCGDRLGSWLAEAHRVLSRIGAGQYPEEGSVAEATGDWGTSDGSFSYALGLGLLFGRVGRHWLLRKGDYERSLAYYRLAALLYKSLGATVNLAKSLVDQGSVYQALGERKTALTLYEQALDASAVDLNARSTLAPGWQLQRIMLANDVFQLYQEDRNPDGMERSTRR
jgi:tetratricopeptide (TPR) repeat protein